MNRPSVLFVSGFDRSGTTLLVAALTEAVGGVTTPDRGVDRLPVTPTSQDYNPAVPRRQIDMLRRDAPDATVVLKNAYEVGNEAELLRDFPEAAVLLLRRRLPDIEASIGRAHRRTKDKHQKLAKILDSRWRSAAMRFSIRLDLCRRASVLAQHAPDLPGSRVAFLSYEELRDDPVSGAAWAAHLVDPDALAEAYARHLVPERSVDAAGGALVRFTDRRWATGWQQARAGQRPAGPRSGSSTAGRTNG